MENRRPPMPYFMAYPQIEEDAAEKALRSGEISAYK